MNKVVKSFILVMICGLFVTSTSAKSLRDVTVIGGESTYIIKYDTEGKFYTCVTPTYLNDNITIENTIQRKNSSGKWTNVARAYLSLEKVNVNRDHDVNYSFNKTADTRTIWANITRGTTVKGNFYINNGSEADITFNPVYYG